MKTALFNLVALLILCSSAQATEFEISKGNDLSETVELTHVTTFKINNPKGDIHVFPITGEELVLIASYQGEDSAKLLVEEPTPGKMLLTVEYPNNDKGSTTSTFNFSNSSSVIMINGKKFGSTSSSFTVTQGEHLTLKVGIPVHLFGHLKAESKSGNVTLKGDYDPVVPSQRRNLAHRQIHLEAENGNIVCEGSCDTEMLKATTRNGNIEISGVNGNIFVDANHGKIKALNNTGDITAHSKHGNITVKFQKEGAVYAHTKHGNVDLENPKSATEIASSKHGRVRGLSIHTQTAECIQNLVAPDPFDF